MTEIPLNSSNGKNLAELTNRRCDVALGIWGDTNFITSGSADYYVVCTGMWMMFQLLHTTL
jgi:hypothetical protein